MDNNLSELRRIALEKHNEQISKIANIDKNEQSIRNREAMYRGVNAHLKGREIANPDIHAIPVPPEKRKPIVYYPPAQQSQNPPQKGGKKSYCTYNNRQYLVHKGSRGGNYILVGQDKKRVYV